MGTSSVGDMLDEFVWPSLEARREQSSLEDSHRYSVLERDKNLTPEQNQRRTRASNDSQYPGEVLLFWRFTTKLF